MKLRPRFSLRTLVILVTLVCAYFGAWELTKKKSSQFSFYEFDRGGSTLHLGGVSAPLPLVISRNELDYETPRTPTPLRRHYFWLYGFDTLVKLPFESQWRADPNATTPDVSVSSDDKGGVQVELEDFGPQPGDPR